jgi:hypothetical protein
LKEKFAMRALCCWSVICMLFPLALAAGEEQARPDPIPLRRVNIGPERVPAELERVQKGMLVLLPRAEFEAKVQKAAAAVELANAPPRLSKTRYTARLTDMALVGKAEWTAVHTAPGPGILALPDFNLALTKRVMVDDAEGMLGEMDGKSSALLISKGGKPTIHFEWSRRGTSVTSGVQFELRVPPCANAQLELTVPSEYQLIVSKPGLFVESLQPQSPGAPGGKVGQRTWLIGFSGMSQLEFILRRLETGTPLLLASVRSRQVLNPDRVLADYDFEIEALHGSVSELVFDGDAPLQPYTVTLGGVEVKNWQWQPRSIDQDNLPAGGGKRDVSLGGGVLVIPLHEPLHGTLPTLQIRCLAPIMGDKKERVWVSPGLRLRAALPRGERLRLEALPETHLEQLTPGQFRMTKATSASDGTQLFTLVYGGPALSNFTVDAGEAHLTAAAGGAAGTQSMPPERPTAKLKARATEFLLEQQSWWQLDPHGSTLMSEITCKPSRGQLYHLPLRLPPESQVDQLIVQPKEALRGWAIAGPTLFIDLLQPATAEKPVKIELHLRLPPPPLTLVSAGGGKGGRPLTLDLLDIEPLVPCLREGALAITVHPQWSAQVLQSSWPATAAPEAAIAGPWRRTSPDYYFAFRGKPLTGKLRLQTRSTQFRATCQIDAYVGGSRGTLASRLTIEPISGAVDHVDFLVGNALAEPWKIRGEPANSRTVVQRLPGLDVPAGLLALGAGHGLGAAAIMTARPAHDYWRLVFAEPVRERTTVVLETSFNRALVPGARGGASAERLWAIPVVSVTGAEQCAGELAVQLIGAEVTTATVDHLQEITRPTGKTAAPRGHQQVWRVFRYDGSTATGKLPSLQVIARPVAVQLAAREICETAALTTYVELNGPQRHWLHFQLTNWLKSEVPVQLPSGAKVLAARSEGRWLSSLPEQTREDGVEINLPASQVAALQDFDLCYEIPGGVSAWTPWSTVAATIPKLPVRPLDMRQTWVLPVGLVPISGDWHQVTGNQAWMGLSEGERSTSWEPTPSVELQTKMMLVRPLALHLVGIFFAGLLALAWATLACRMQSLGWQPWRARSLILWAGLTAILMVWLPASMRPAAAWPAAMAAVLGTAWYFAIAWGRNPFAVFVLAKPVRSAAIGCVGAITVGVAGMSLPPASSQSLDAGTVLVLPGTVNAPERQDVLVTPELLKTLENLSERGPSGLRGAVLVAATYQGVLAGEVAHLHADFKIHNFGEKTTLTIPLGGVDLGEGALFDGAPVEVLASANGFEVIVQGIGTHRLTLPLTVRIKTTAEHHDLHFTVPRLIQNQLLLHSPVSFSEPQVMSGYGAVVNTAVNAKHRELMVDLGRDSAVQIRWPRIDSAAQSVKVTVREAYYWDLRSPGSACTALLNYNVKAGSVSRLTVALPDILEPRSVGVSGEGADGEGSTRKPLLKDWCVEGDNGLRQVVVDLLGPASGDMVLTLNLVPRHPLGPGTVRLPLPLPLASTSIGGLVGYRAPGFDVTDKALNIMTLLLPSEQFSQQWQENGPADAIAPTRAFSFRRPSPASALAPTGIEVAAEQEVATLVVSLTPRRPSFEQELLWTFHPGRVDLEAKLKGGITEDDLLLVEWEVPPRLTIAEIAGENIRSWTRAAGQSTVQVWLKQPAKSVAFNLHGWTLHASPNPPPIAAEGKLGGSPLPRWELPCLRCLNAANTRTIVRIAESGGVSARPDLKKFVNLTPLAPTNRLPPQTPLSPSLPSPAGKFGGGKDEGPIASWVCQGPSDSYHAEFTLRFMLPPARVTAMTTAEARDGALHLMSRWLVYVPHASTARLTMRVDNWGELPLKLEGPGDLIIRPVPAPPGQRRWQITIPAGAPRHAELKLTGARPCQTGTVVELPSFRLTGAALNDHWLVARRPGLGFRSAAGLADVKSLPAPSLPSPAAG